jgi:hypothetical protein
MKEYDTTYRNIFPVLPVRVLLSEKYRAAEGAWTELTHTSPVAYDT